MSSKMKTNGFTLVEVLIAMVVISVGMLGIAGLYVQTLQAGRTSLFRHQAIMLAGDVADRIRANPTAGVTYEGEGDDSGSCINGGVDCTPLQMAQQDILAWGAQATDSLPNGAVTVDYDNSTVPSTYAVTIGWSEAGQSPAPSYSISVLTLEM